MTFKLFLSNLHRSLSSPNEMLKLALASSLVFLLTLHPITSWPGGLIFLLIGWAIPNFFLLALCTGIAALFSRSRQIQLVAFLSALFILGINTDLPRMITLMNYKETTKMEIRSVAQLSNQKYPFVNVQYAPWPRVYTKPFGARVQIGGDEGCGCFYFKDAEDTIYSDRAIDALKVLNNKNTPVMREDTFSNYKDNDIHMNLSFYPYKTENKLLMVAEIYEAGSKTAEFLHEDIPSSIDIERNGVGRDRIMENFFENAFDILLHDNFISHLMNAVLPSYFPQKAIDKFFKEAVSA